MFFKEGNIAPQKASKGRARFIQFLFNCLDVSHDSFKASLLVDAYHFVMLFDETLLRPFNG